MRAIKPFAQVCCRGRGQHEGGDKCWGRYSRCTGHNLTSNPSGQLREYFFGEAGLLFLWLMLVLLIFEGDACRRDPGIDLTKGADVDSQIQEIPLKVRIEVNQLFRVHKDAPVR